MSRKFLVNLRLPKTGAVGLASDVHPLSIGETTGENMAIDHNVVQARNNGVGTNLFLNYHGGAVYLPADPTSALGAATKQYVDGKAGGFTFVQDTQPTPTAAKQTWFDTSTASTGGTSWVAMEEAPAGQLVWVQFAPGAGASLAPVGGIWRRVANQSVPSATTTAIIWDTEDADTNGFAAPGNATVTIQVDGVYSITFFVYVAGEAGQALLSVSSISPPVIAARSNAINGWAVVSITTRLAVGATFTCQAWQNAGAPLNIPNSRLELWKVA